VAVEQRLAVGEEQVREVLVEKRRAALADPGLDALQIVADEVVGDEAERAVVATQTRRKSRRCFETPMTTISLRLPAKLEQMQSSLAIEICSIIQA